MRQCECFIGKRAFALLTCLVHLARLLMKVCTKANMGVSCSPQLGRAEKNDTYLSLFVISGQWFDGSQPASFVNLTMDPDFAPEFLLTHLDKYKELVEK